MADAFGNLTLPAQGGLPAVTDPLLSYLPDYLKAVLIADLGEAWSEVSTQAIVKVAGPHDPEKAAVNDKDFPAIYVWRSDFAPGELGDDLSGDLSRVRILWIFAPEKQHRLVDQLPIINGIHKSIKRSLDYGRHPAWVAEDETDPAIQARGSLIWRYTGVTSHKVIKSGGTEIVITHYDGGKLKPYQAVLTEIDVMESLIRDPTAYPGSAPSALTDDIIHPGSTDVRLGAVEDPPEA